jgi:hypothetical protein
MEAAFRYATQRRAPAATQPMKQSFVHAVVQAQPRKVIHVIRVVDDVLTLTEVHELAERMRQHALSRWGDQAADVVVVQGGSKETLRLFGEPHSVTRVRAAMFNATVAWTPIAFD